MNYIIMIIDDEQVMLYKIEQLLNSYFKDKNYNFKLIKFDNPNLLNTLDIEQTDLFILDIEMEDSNGIDVAINIRKIKKDAIIMFVSGHPDYKDDAFHIKANAYIDKPIDSERFYLNMNMLISEVDKSNLKLEVLRFGKKIIINANEIMCVKPGKLCSKIITKNDEYDYENSFISASKNLQRYYFLAQINGKCLINLNYLYENKKNSVVLKNSDMKLELKKSVRFTPYFNKQYLKYQEKTYDRQF